MCGSEFSRKTAGACPKQVRPLNGTRFIFPLRFGPIQPLFFSAKLHHNQLHCMRPTTFLFHLISMTKVCHQWNSLVVSIIMIYIMIVYWISAKWKTEAREGEKGNITPNAQNRWHFIASFFFVCVCSSLACICSISQDHVMFHSQRMRFIIASPTWCACTGGFT